MPTLEQITEEYRRTFLLHIFQKLCTRMDKDIAYRRKTLTLFRQSDDRHETTRIIIKKEFEHDLTKDDAVTVYKWLSAYFNKSDIRRKLPETTKTRLYQQQKGLCAICRKVLGADWSNIHVDHIIPFVMVGDELEDNYQLLCDTCNQCKSSKTDYIFKSLLGLD